MADPRKQDWLPYICDLADRLRLRDWDLAIDDAPPPGTGEAAIWVQTDGTNARIRLSEDFLEFPAEGQRATVVHELLHLHFARMNTVCCEEIPDGPARRAYDHAFERSIEATAKAVAVHYPLPLFAIGVDEMARKQAPATKAPSKSMPPHPGMPKDKAVPTAGPGKAAGKKGMGKKMGKGKTC